MVTPTQGTNPYQIREIDIADIPEKRNAGVWARLGGELLLRLEKTSPDKALDIALANSKTAERAAYGIRTFITQKRGKDAVTIAKVDAHLYVRRGSKWPGSPQT